MVLVYLQNWVIYGVNVGNYSSTMEHMSMVKSQVTPFSPQAAMPAEERQTHRNLQVQRGPPGPGKGPFGGAPVVGIDS
jgi:hypothetical protein